MGMRVQFALGLALWASSMIAGSTQVVVPLDDCGQWMQAREAKQAQAWVYQSYVVGLLTGMSMASNVPLLGNSPQARVSDEQVYFWMDEYCRKNPLRYLEDGVLAFANETSHDTYHQAVERASKAGAHSAGVN
jgi:hypothetical protein